MIGKATPNDARFVLSALRENTDAQAFFDAIWAMRESGRVTQSKGVWPVLPRVAKPTAKNVTPIRRGSRQ